MRKLARNRDTAPLMYVPSYTYSVSTLMNIVVTVIIICYGNDRDKMLFLSLLHNILCVVCVYTPLIISIYYDLVIGNNNGKNIWCGQPFSLWIRGLMQNSSGVRLLSGTVWDQRLAYSSIC